MLALFYHRIGILIFMKLTHIQVLLKKECIFRWSYKKILCGPWTFCEHCGWQLFIFIFLNAAGERVQRWTALCACFQRW